MKYKARCAYAVSPQNIPLGATGTENNSLTGITYTEYCVNYVYENGILKKILTPEGYISTMGSVPLNYINLWKHNYLLKDHLGNTRRVLMSNMLSSTSTVLNTLTQPIDYYPFGMEVTQVSDPNVGNSYLAGAAIPYLYSGSEIERLNGLNQHDFHARWLDNAVPGFTTPDPLAERNWAESPYVYCGSDPVNRIDPLGLDWYWNKAGDKTPVWFEGSKDVPGFDTHAPTCWLYTANYRYHFLENGNIDVYPLEGGYLSHSYERNYESLYNAYGFVPPRHDEDEENSENVSDGISISSTVISLMTSPDSYESAKKFYKNPITNKIISWTGKNGNFYKASEIKLNGGMLKSMNIAEGVSKTSKLIGNIGSAFGIGTSLLTIGFAIYNDNHNTSTWVNAAVGIGTGILTIVAAPHIVATAAIIGVIWGVTQIVAGDKINEAIDKNLVIDNKQWKHIQKCQTPFC